jgi:xylan 1,4-beta-xylosidase
VRKGKNLTVMLTNHALPRHEIKTEQLRIELKNMASPRSVSLQRIDENHANPRRAWTEMGAPEYLKQPQIDRLEAASRLRREKLPFHSVNGAVSFEITLLPQSVATVTVECEANS